MIDAKYDAMLQQLRDAPATPGAIEALPGWIARRRGTLPPAGEVLDALPAGRHRGRRRPARGRAPKVLLEVRVEACAGVVADGRSTTRQGR